MSYLVRVSLHPVQAYIDASRRLRDLLNASMLLSNAMQGLRQEVEKRLGSSSILLPSGATRASHPNYIVFELPQTDEADVTAVCSSLRDYVLAWLENALLKILQNVHVRAGALVSFDGHAARQGVSETFHVRWIAVPRSEELHHDLHHLELLSQARKRTRAFTQPKSVAGEIRCSLCGERDRVLPTKSVAGIPPSEFWSQAPNLGGIAVNIRHNEHLCPTCLGKRLGPVGSKMLTTWDVAVAAWRVNVKANFAGVVSEIDGAMIRLKEAAGVAGLEVGMLDTGFDDMEGSIFSGDISQFLPDIDYLPPKLAQPVKHLYDEFLEIIAKKLRDAPRRPDQYAVLLMDGDEMGKWFSGRGWHSDAGQPLRDRLRQLGDALALVAAKTARVIAQAKGTLIYAGGDDLMALLPPETALEAARKCRQLYTNELNRFGGDGTSPTISAALIFAHPRRPPMSLAIRCARESLELAKKSSMEGGFSRNSLVCSVLLPSQKVYACGGKWDVGTPVVLPALEILSENLGTVRLASGLIPDLLSAVSACSLRGKLDAQCQSMLKDLVNFYVCRHANRDLTAWSVSDESHWEARVNQCADNVWLQLQRCLPADSSPENLNGLLHVAAVFARKEIA